MCAIFVGRVRLVVECLYVGSDHRGCKQGSGFEKAPRRPLRIPHLRSSGKQILDSPTGVVPSAFKYRSDAIAGSGLVDHSRRRVRVLRPRGPRLCASDVQGWRENPTMGELANVDAYAAPARLLSIAFLSSAWWPCGGK
jgi:hypothetical protein